MKNKVISATENVKQGKMVKPDWWFDRWAQGEQRGAFEDKHLKKSLNSEEAAGLERSGGKVGEDERSSA